MTAATGRRQVLTAQEVLFDSRLVLQIDRAVDVAASVLVVEAAIDDDIVVDERIVAARNKIVELCVCKLQLNQGVGAGAPSCW